jgi:hypothetical protein
MGLDFNQPAPAAAASGEIEHPLDELLEDARMAASTDWEEDFVADQLANRKKYGARWRPTDGQVAKLRQIADGPSEDDRRGYGRSSPYWVDRDLDDDIPF